MTNRAGFTLLELTVAIVLAAAVVAIGHGAVAYVTDARTREAERAGVVERAARVRQQLSAWLGGARIMPGAFGPAFEGVDAGSDSESSDRLTFLTSASSPAGMRRPILTLFIDDDPATAERGLVAELREWNGTAMERIEVVPEAATLDISYMTGEDVERRRVRSWVSSSLLPRAVEITLGPADSLPALLRLPLLVAIGSAR